MEFSDRTDDYTSVVSCNVKTCKYHDGEYSCTAGKIDVGPTYASSATDTICATFKPKK